MPELSIVMPVFNQEKYIKESVESILNQTYTDFELLIINDGSIDNTKKIIQENFDDKRIKLIDNEYNNGIIYSLNKGLSLSLESKFIARMDGDDHSSPNRFQVQIDFLKQNKDVGLVGSRTRFFGEGIKTRVINYPTCHKKIMSTFLCLNPFGHPTVLFRSSLINDEDGLRYNTEFPRYEDYAMWMSFINKTKFANTEEVLVNYRRHAENITNKEKKNLLDSFPIIKKLIDLYFNKCAVTISDDDVNTLAAMLSDRKTEISENEFMQTLIEIKSALPESKIDKIFLSKIMYRCFLKYFPKAKYFNASEKLRKKLKIDAISALNIWQSLIIKNSFPN